MLINLVQKFNDTTNQIRFGNFAALRIRSQEARIDNLLEWENLWILAFAADPGNPVDFSNGFRSPSGLIEINYDAYVCDYGRIYDADYEDDDLEVTLASPKGYSNVGIENVVITSIEGDDVYIVGQIDDDCRDRCLRKFKDKRKGKHKKKSGKKCEKKCNRKCQLKKIEAAFDFSDHPGPLSEVCLEMELSDGNVSCPTCIAVDND